MQHIIIDLEFTPIPKKFCGTVRNEIIEIGAVRLDDSYKYVDSFSTFVRPQLAQDLSYECEHLTGIHPVNLHNAPFFHEALALLETWIGTEPFRIYQWSDNDHTQIVGECALKGVTSPLCSKHWIDLQRLYCRIAGLERVVSLERALSSLNIDVYSAFRSVSGSKPQRGADRGCYRGTRHARAYNVPFPLQFLFGIGFWQGLYILIQCNHLP